MSKWIAGMTFIMAFALSMAAQACTDFKLAALDHSVLVTRTMEFATDLKSQLRTSNRGRQFSEVTPDNKAGLQWKAQYGYVFLDGLDMDVALDGMNEAGMSFEYLYLPGETSYQTVPAGKDAQGLSYLHLGDWVLSNFKSVDEVKAALQKIYVYSQTLPALPNIVFPLHASIYDATGKGIVVEFVNGKMNIFDNEVGVLTNSPTYDWQVVNLRNYVNLSPWSPTQIVSHGLVFAATGQGSGMKGLPGDISPPSRFVKMNVLKAAAYQPATMTQALNTAQHIVNNVDIPLGIVRAKQNDQVVNEYTQWTVFKDLTNKVFYYRTFADSTLHAVRLDQLDFSENARRLKMSIVDDQYIMEMTKQFSGSRAIAPPTVSAALKQITV